MGSNASTYCKVGLYFDAPKTLNMTFEESLKTNFYLDDYAGDCKPASSPDVLSFTNTNACIELSIKLQNCLIALDDACCIPAQEFRELGCECNQAIEYLTVENDPSGNGQATWEAFSEALVPICESNLGRSFAKPNCNHFKTFRRGCKISDNELEKGRLQSALEFSKPFQSAGLETQCFDLELIQATLYPWVTKDVAADIPYGIGFYQGINDMFEYVGIFWNALNHGTWTSGAIEPSSGFIGFANNSMTLDMRALASGGLANNAIPYSELLLSQSYEFRECDTKISRFTVKPDESMAYLAASFHKISSNFDEFGRRDICEYAMKYCTGDLQQYDSFDACMEYLDTVPDYSPACQPEQKVLSGNSVTCRFKHHFMIPLVPEKHCPHIGQDGNPNRGNVKHKCEDVYECRGLPDDSWAPLQVPENGVPLEQEWIDASVASNAATTLRVANEEPWIFESMCDFNCNLTIFGVILFCDQAKETYDIDLCCDTMNKLELHSCFCDKPLLIGNAGGQSVIDANNAVCSVVPQICD